MKTRYYVGGLALGALIGVGIGYWIATDPVKRRKINRFVRNAEDKIEDVKDNLVDKFENIKDNLTQTVSKVRHQAEDVYETVEEKVERKLQEELDELEQLEAIAEAACRADTKKHKA